VKYLLPMRRPSLLSAVHAIVTGLTHPFSSLTLLLSFFVAVFVPIVTTFSFINFSSRCLVVSDTLGHFSHIHFYHHSRS
jgi:hypothetical protein